MFNNHIGDDILEAKDCKQGGERAKENLKKVDSSDESWLKMDLVSSPVT